MDYYSLYDHELRTIRIEYNTENRPSEFEEKAVLEYRNMHNDLLALKKAFPKINEGLQKLEMDMPKLEEDIAILETEIKKCGPLAGYTDEECEQMGMEEGQIDVNALLKKVFTHKDLMDNCFTETHKQKDARKKWEEGLNTLYEKIDLFEETYFNPIIQNHKEMEIYTTAFDEDVQQFYGLLSDLGFTTQRKFAKRSNEYTIRFNAYLERVRQLFSRTEKLRDSADKIVNRRELGDFGLN